MINPVFKMFVSPVTWVFVGSAVLAITRMQSPRPKVKIPSACVVLVVAEAYFKSADFMSVTLARILNITVAALEWSERITLSLVHALKVVAPAMGVVGVFLNTSILCSFAVRVMRAVNSIL